MRDINSKLNRYSAIADRQIIDDEIAIADWQTSQRARCPPFGVTRFQGGDAGLCVAGAVPYRPAPGHPAAAVPALHLHLPPTGNGEAAPEQSGHPAE